MPIRQEQLGNITELDKDNSGEIDVNNARIINVHPPVDGYDVATKNYVDTYGGGGGVTDHGALTGLSDDDHTQYILVNGTRAFSGNISLGNNKVVNLATPTASGDAVNKSYVDGYSGWANVNIATNANIAVTKLAGGVGNDSTSVLKLSSGVPEWSQLSHSALSGNLTGDPHTQYILASGTRAFSGDVSIGNNKITNLANPIDPNDAVNKTYVDGYMGWKNNNIATDANIAVSKLEAGSDGYVLKTISGVPTWSETIPGGVTDHGALTGLTDDDHLQYLRTDGSRALTGNIDADGYRITDLGTPIIGTDAATKAYVDGYVGWTNLTETFNITKAPSGFPNRTDSIISKNDNTLTFTIAPAASSYDFLVKGIKYTKSSIININWTDVEGIHYFYFNSFGTLQHSVNTNDWEDVILGNGVLVAMLYWDETNNKTLMFNEERHGFMDGASHLHFHHSFGTQWYSGGSFNNFVVDADGSLASHAQLSISNIEIADEDIDFNIIDGAPQELSPIAEIPIYYRTGINGVWRMKDADVFPLIYQGTAGYGSGLKPPWNEFTGSSWQLTELTDSKYFLMHYYATTDLNHPVVGIQGQQEYNSVAEAQSNVSNEVASINNQLQSLMIERTPLGSVVFQTGNLTNAPQARIRSVSGGNYIDLRRSPVLGIAASVQSHGSLTNLDNDDHLQYLRTDGSRALTGNQSAGGFKITNLSNPTDAYDAATKSYVDNNSGIDFSNLNGIISNRPELRVQYLNLTDDNINNRITISPLGKFPKITVSAATTSNIDLTTASTINDGVSLAPGSNLWVRAQNNPSENGVYFLSWRSGSSAYYERWTDIDNIISVSGAYLFVGGGTLRGGKAYYIDTNWNATEIDPLSVSWQEVDVEDYSLVSDGTDIVPAYNRAQHAMGLGGKIYFRRSKFYTLGSQLQITRKSMAISGLGLTGTVITANNSGGIRVRYTLTSTPAANCSPNSNITLSGVQNIDGVTGVAGTTVVLVTEQTNQAQNGLYIMQSGAWTRHPELDADGEFDRGVTTAVLSGTLRGRTRWVIVNDAPYTVNVTPVVYQQVVGYGAPWYPEAQSGPMRFERFNIQYSGSRTESNDYHAIEGNQGFYADEVYIFNFPGSGIRIYGDVPESNSNKGYLNRVRVVNVGLSGFHFVGGDSNAWQIIGCDASGAGARTVVGDCFGFYENSFLGNYYYGCHAANCVYGGYLAFDASNQSVFLGCYVENDSPAWISGSAMFFGANLDRIYNTWTANTVKSVGDFVASGFNIWRCTTAGTTGGTQPAWTTALDPNDVVGSIIVDGTVTWTCWAAFSGVSNKGFIARNDGIGVGQMLTRSPGGTSGLANFWGGTDGTDEMEKFSISADSGYTRKYVSSGAGTGIYGWLHTNSTSRLAFGITATASIRSYGIACAPNGITLGPSFAVKLIGGLESALPLVSTTSTSTVSGVYELGDLWFVQQADQYRPDLLRVTNKSGSNLTWTPKWYANRRFDVANSAPSSGIYDKGDLIRDIGSSTSQKSVRLGWQLSNRAGTTTNIWSASAAKTAGTYIKPNPLNGFIYKAIVGGTTGGSQPTFPTTIGQTVVDNTVTWECWGADSLDWQVIAHPSDGYGPNLTDSDENLQVSDGSWRRLLLLTGDRNKTLLTTGANKGDQIEITRLDISEFNCNIVNGGPSGGIISVLPKNQKNFGLFQYNGTDWELRRIGTYENQSLSSVLSYGNNTGANNIIANQNIIVDGYVLTKNTNGIGPLLTNLFNDSDTAAIYCGSSAVASQSTTNYAIKSDGTNTHINSTAGSYIRVADQVKLTAASTYVRIHPSELYFTASATPLFYSEPTGTNSITGATFTIRGQNCTGTNTIGGDLILSSGTGTNRDGYVRINLNGNGGRADRVVMDGYKLTVDHSVVGNNSSRAVAYLGALTSSQNFSCLWMGQTKTTTLSNTSNFALAGSTTYTEINSPSSTSSLFISQGGSVRLSLAGNGIYNNSSISNYIYVHTNYLLWDENNPPILSIRELVGTVSGGDFSANVKGADFIVKSQNIQSNYVKDGYSVSGGDLILAGGSAIAIDGYSRTLQDGYVKIRTGTSDRLVLDGYKASFTMPSSSATIGLGGVSLTGQTADISSTNLITSPSAGLYSLDIYMLCTTAGTAGTATLTIGWTDDVGSTTSTPVSTFSLSTQGRITARQLIRVSSGNITYSVSRAGVTGSPQYALYMQLERIR
jgi:hypothetical protein